MPRIHFPLFLQMGRLFFKLNQDLFFIPKRGLFFFKNKLFFFFLFSRDDIFSFELSDVGDSSSTLSILESNAVLSARKNQLSIGPGEQKNNYVDYLYYRISLDLFMNISYDDQYYILPVL